LEHRSPSYLPIVIIIAIFAVSTASLFIKLAQREAPSLVIAAVRLTLASLLLAPSAFSNYKNEIRGFTKKESLLIIISGFFLALHFATWISSLEYTSVASSVIIVSTGPLWVALLSSLFLHEKLTKTVFWGMILAVSGGTIIAISDSCSWQGGLLCPPLTTFLHGKSLFGDILALFGALTVTGYLLIGRKLRVKISLIPYIFLVYSIAATVLIVLMVIAGQTPFGYSINIYIWLFLLALIPQIIGHSTYNWALRFLPATFVAVTTLGEPIGATILAFFILNETPGFFKLGGAIIILVGIFIATRTKKEVRSD